MQRLETLPGVRGVATALEPPLTSGENTETGMPEGYVPPDGKQVDLDYNIVSRSYLRTLEIPLAAGRDFDRTDTRESPRSVIVNEALVQRYWPGANAIGKRIVMSRRDTLTVIGVARNAKYHSLSESPMPHIYVLADQQKGIWTSPMTLLVRAEGDVEQLLAPIRSELRKASANVPVVTLASYGDQFATVLAPQRIAATLLGFFGLLALAVAAVGVSGVVAYALSQRTREIGIRMALGAPAGSVLRMILGENLRRVLVGVVLGLALAAAASQVAVDLLYGVRALDPVTFILTPLLLIVVALIAALLPARRATEVDPLVALRSE
jgi:predicted permease